MGATGLLTRAKQLQQTQQNVLEWTEATRRPLRHYDEHFVDLERAFLTLLSAFRSAMRVNALEKVFSMMQDTHAVPLPVLDHAAFETLLDRLVASRVLLHHPNNASYELHPLVRAHYLSQLAASSRSDDLSGIAVGSVTPSPRTPNDLQPLIEAVHRACRVGAYDEACDIYLGSIQKIQRGELAYQMGTYEVNLMLLTEFFPSGDLNRDPEAKDSHERAWLLNEVGLCLTKLGRLREAVPFYQRAQVATQYTNDWFNASISNQNLAHLYHHLGQLEEGTHAASDALTQARQTKNVKLERDALIYSARSAYLYGDLQIARIAFERGEALAKVHDPEQRYLTSSRGIWHAEYFKRAGDIASARYVTETNLKQWAIPYRWRHDESSCHRILGEIAGMHAEPVNAMGTGLLNMPGKGPLSTRQALGHFNKAMWIAQGIAHHPTLIEALLARGRWAARGPQHHIVGKETVPNTAFSDLNEALGYAVASSYRVYEADIRAALAWAHLNADNIENARQQAIRAQSMSEEMGYHWGKVDAEEVLEIITVRSEA